MPAPPASRITGPLTRRKVKAGRYALYEGERLRAEIVWLPDAINVYSMDHWLVYIDGDNEHCEGCKAATLREAEANTRHRIAWDDLHPPDCRSDQQRSRDSRAAH